MHANHPVRPVTTIEAPDAVLIQDQLHRRGCEAEIVANVRGAETVPSAALNTARRVDSGVEFGELWVSARTVQQPGPALATKRSRHLRSLFASTWKRSADAAIDQRRPSTQRTIR